MNRNLTLAALLFLLMAGQAEALPDDRTQPITLKAERVDINQKKGVSTYEGNVELQQGSMAVSASRIVVYHQNNEISRIEADGTPVKIRQRPAPGKEETRAEARHVEYDPKTSTLRLNGQAHIWQDGNEFRGETIVFDSQHNIVRAHGSGKKGDQKNGRIEVIIKPHQETRP